MRSTWRICEKMAHDRLESWIHRRVCMSTQTDACKIAVQHHGWDRFTIQDDADLRSSESCQHRFLLLELRLDLKQLFSWYQENTRSEANSGFLERANIHVSGPWYYRIDGLLRHGW